MEFTPCEILLLLGLLPILQLFIRLEFCLWPFELVRLSLLLPDLSVVGRLTQH